MTGTTDTTRPLDTTELTDGQRRGAACIVCALPVDAATAEMLPNVQDEHGVTLFLRRHVECPAPPAGVAFWDHVEGNGSTPPCGVCADLTDGSFCPEGARLLGAAYVAAGKPQPHGS